MLILAAYLLVVLPRGLLWGRGTPESATIVEAATVGSTSLPDEEFLVDLVLAASIGPPSPVYLSNILHIAIEVAQIVVAAQFLGRRMKVGRKGIPRGWNFAGPLI
jgi:hypothetical protein